MILTLPDAAKYKIWKVPAHWASRWVVIRPDLTIVGYFRTWDQALNAFMGDALAAQLLRRAVPS